MNDLRDRRFLAALVSLTLVWGLVSGPLPGRAATPCTDAACAAVMFFSEVGWAGSSVSQADEWFEIANGNAFAVDISGWSIEGAGSSGNPIILPANSVIAAQTTFLIANYAETSSSSTLNVHAHYINTAVSLSNSALLLLLKDRAGMEIDRAGSGSAPFFGGTKNGGGVSMERVDGALAGSNASAWREATESDGFDTESLERGTPGFHAFPEEETAAPTESAMPTETPAETLPDTEAFETNTQDASSPEETSVSEDPPPSAEDSEAQTVEETADVPADEQAVESWTEEGSMDPPADATTPDTEQVPAEEIPSSSSSNQTVSLSYDKGTFVINEFVSDPVKDQPEWVEILNPYNNVIRTGGWSVRESSGRTVPLPDQLLGWEQLIVVEFGSGALNNDGDIITLLDPTGNTVDAVSYGTASVPAATDPDATARRPDGTFAITTTPTSGATNTITEPVIAQKTTSQAKTTTSGTPSAPSKKGSSAQAVAVSKESSAAAAPETAPTSSFEETETENPQTDQSALRLSELYANTEGSDAEDEFIEIENTGDEPVDLAGIRLEDASGKGWTYEEHTWLDPGTWYAIGRDLFGFALNNQGNESVLLYDAEETLLDETSYTTAPKGMSYARFEEAWEWTALPTPHAANKRSGTEGADTSEESAEDEAKDDLPIEVGIADARSRKAGTRVKVSGIVSVPPGVLGLQIMYLVDADSGIQLFKSDGDFPSLSIGDMVEVTGTLSSNRGETRIKVSTSDTIALVESGPEPKPEDVEAVGEESEGRLVRVRGYLREKKRDRLVLEAGEETITVRLKEGAEIDLDGLEEGATVEAVGVVSQSGTTYAVLPRAQEDLAWETPSAAQGETVIPDAHGKETAVRERQRNAWILGSSTVVAVGGFVVRHLLHAKLGPSL